MNKNMQLTVTCKCRRHSYTLGETDRFLGFPGALTVNSVCQPFTASSLVHSQGTFFNDLVLSLFCEPCALVQEAQVGLDSCLCCAHRHTRHSHTHVCNKRISMHTHTHTYACTHTHAHTHARTYTHTHTHTHARTHAHTHTHRN